MDKYTTSDLLIKEPLAEKDKIILSNDAYAVSEMLDILINKIDTLRLAFING